MNVLMMIGTVFLVHHVTTRWLKLAKFRKKPIVVDAFQLDMDVDGYCVVPAWFNHKQLRQNSNGDKMIIETPEGLMIAKNKDWIIKGIEGEIYPCKEIIFEKTYEEIDYEVVDVE